MSQETALSYQWLNHFLVSPGNSALSCSSHLQLLKHIIWVYTVFPSPLQQFRCILSLNKFEPQGPMALDALDWSKLDRTSRQPRWP